MVRVELAERLLRVTNPIYQAPLLCASTSDEAHLFSSKSLMPGVVYHHIGLLWMPTTLGDLPKSVEASYDV